MAVLIGCNLTREKTWEEFSSVTLHKGLIWPKEDISVQLPAIVLRVELCKRLAPELEMIKNLGTLHILFAIWNASGISFTSLCQLS